MADLALSKMKIPGFSAQLLIGSLQPEHAVACDRGRVSSICMYVIFIMCLAGRSGSA